jgi:hypothetical protein
MASRGACCLLNQWLMQKLLLAALFFIQSFSLPAMASDDIGQFVKENEAEVATEIHKHKQELIALKNEVHELQTQIEITEQKIFVTNVIRDSTVVVSIGLALLIGKVLKRDLFTKVRTNPISIRIIGKMIAATGVVATGRHAYGHYLILIKAKDLAKFKTILLEVDHDVAEQLALFAGSP